MQKIELQRGTIEDFYNLLIQNISDYFNRFV
jgi:hypothetical protein